MTKLLSLAALFGLSVAAADITGTWKGTAETPNGTIERTFVFRQEGTKLTGETISQRTGKSEIREGKVEGDKVSFTVNMNFQGNDVKVNYTGTVSGDEIKFRAEAAEGGFGVDYVAKKTT
jgi:hypothetical protein